MDRSKILLYTLILFSIPLLIYAFYGLISYICYTFNYLEKIRIGQPNHSYFFPETEVILLPVVILISIILVLSAKKLKEN